MRMETAGVDGDQESRIATFICPAAVYSLTLDHDVLQARMQQGHVVRAVDCANPATMCS